MSSPAPLDSAAKFDPGRAAEYDRQARIALAGYEAMHELGACCLAASLGAGGRKSLLTVGIGTGQDIVTIGRLEPGWRFTAVDPSPSMIALAETRLQAEGLLDRTELKTCRVEDLPETQYDGATLIGVLHHLPDAASRIALLTEIARRLKRGAPLILGGNCQAYDSEPLLLAAWKQRWRLHGVEEAATEAQFARIAQGVRPPESEAEVLRLLEAAGFTGGTQFFASLFWGGWIAHKA